MKMLVGMFIGSGVPLLFVKACNLDPVEVYAVVMCATLGLIPLIGLAGCYIADAGTHTHAGVARKP